MYKVLPVADFYMLFSIIFWSSFVSFETGIYKFWTLEGYPKILSAVHCLQAIEQFNHTKPVISLPFLKAF